MDEKANVKVDEKREKIVVRNFVKLLISDSFSSILSDLSGLKFYF